VLGLEPIAPTLISRQCRVHPRWTGMSVKQPDPLEPGRAFSRLHRKPLANRPLGGGQIGTPRPPDHWR
jgi:hypothetical protein